MGKGKTHRMGYRYYETPPGCPVLALLGESWTINYGRDIDYLHLHNHLEIGYCYQGDGTITLENETIPYAGHMFTVIPKEFPHTTYSKEGHICSWEFLFIDADGFLKEIFKDNLSRAQHLIHCVNRKAYISRENDHNVIAGLVRQMIELMRERPVFYVEEIKGLTLALLIELARNAEVEHEVKRGGKENIDRGSTIISMALEYISKYYRCQIQIEELARMCHISETHFRRVFHECMGMTPVEYINRIRIKRACDELRSCDDPISAIAIRSGFVSLSTFNRNFRSVMGVTPQQWRKNPAHYEKKIID